MSDAKTPKLVIAAVIMLMFQGCVSKSTFDDMAGQTQRLDADLIDLQGRYQGLLARQVDLQARHNDLLAENEVAIGEKNWLEKERAALLAQKESLIASNRELEYILTAKEDSLTRKIAEQRQELAAQQTEYNSRLTSQTKQIDELEQKLRERELKISDLTGKINALEESIRQKASRISDHEQNIANLGKQLTEQEHRLTVAKGTNDLLNEDLRLLREEKDTEVREMSTTYQALLGKMKSEIDSGQITISELKGKLTVNMVDAILFDSGKAEVKPDGLLVLQRVIDILKEVSGKTIRIEGHTDNIQIIGVLAQKYPTNWELSAARAVNVARFLQERGIDPMHMNAVAYGEYKPVAANTSETGRARNRRIEIILVNRE